ncbi:MAG: ISL3 family transposase [Chthoniobacteraceae bacterium]
MEGLLNLPQLTVEKVTEDNGQFIFIVSGDTPPPKCCDGPCLVKNGTKRGLYLDLPVQGKRVSIWVNRRRWFCKRCQGTVYQDVPHMDKHHAMTERLVRYIEAAGREKPFTTIARKLGVSEGTVRLVFKAYATRILASRSADAPRWIGIGPVTYGHRLWTAVTDVENKTLLDLLPSRSEEAVADFLRGLPGKEAIERVTISMWEPYRKAVTAVLPWTCLMVDRFHIAKQANEAMDRLRSEMATPVSKHGLIRNDRRMILRTPERLNTAQRMKLDTWLGCYPRLKAGYYAKERYRAIWECATRAEAEARYAEWERRLPPDLAPMFRNLILTTEAWREEILASIESGCPAHLYAECVSSLQRSLNPLGRGCSFEVVRAKWLLKCHAPGSPSMTRQGAAADFHFVP